MTEKLSVELFAENDFKYSFTMFWTWPDLIPIAILLLTFFLHLIFKKLIIKKDLRNWNFVITNGSSKLSQELCNQLVTSCHCKVALILRRHEKLAIIDKPNVKLYVYDEENFQSVKTVSQEILEDLGRIDAVVVNELSNVEEDYITQTANNIQHFMNIVITFGPKLSSGGHLITMKSNLISALALRDTASEYLNVIVSFSKNPVNKNLFKTILVKNLNDTQKLGRTCKKIAEGVRSNRSFIRINEPWFFETIFQNFIKMFQIK